MEKLNNISKILKDCPRGIKLYSTIHGECILDDVYNTGIHIKLHDNAKNSYSFNEFGQYGSLNSECLLFPSKENRDWSTFKPPFKDGDIVSYKFSAFENRSIYIYKQHNKMNTSYYVALSGCNDSELLISDKEVCALNGYNSSARLATEEEKQKLFDAIKANGYIWNPETKTLEKLIVPKFKVGDRIKHKAFDTIYTIKEVTTTLYRTNKQSIFFEHQDNWNIIKKFDITTLKAFDKVLVRDSENCLWSANFYSFYKKPYFMTMNGLYAQCIPYNADTKHLLGTDNDCDDYYKTW